MRLKFIFLFTLVLISTQITWASEPMSNASARTSKPKLPFEIDLAVPESLELPPSPLLDLPKGVLGAKFGNLEEAQTSAMIAKFHDQARKDYLDTIKSQKIAADKELRVARRWAKLCCIKNHKEIASFNWEKNVRCCCCPCWECWAYPRIGESKSYLEDFKRQFPHVYNSGMPK